MLTPLSAIQSYPWQIVRRARNFIPMLLHSPPARSSNLVFRLVSWPSSRRCSCSVSKRSRVRRSSGPALPPMKSSIGACEALCSSGVKPAAWPSLNGSLPTPGRLPRQRHSGCPQGFAANGVTVAWKCVSIRISMRWQRSAVGRWNLIDFGNMTAHNERFGAFMVSEHQFLELLNCYLK